MKAINPGHAGFEEYIGPIRTASRQMVRELGFMQSTLAATDYAPSAVHALLEIGARGQMTAAQLVDFLGLDKSSVSRMVRKLIDAGELAAQSSEEDGRSKQLTLTARGLRSRTAIEAYGQAMVVGAMEQLAPAQRQTVAQGLTWYAQALAAKRSGASSMAPPAAPQIAVVSGYRPGALGRVVQMHAEFYAHNAGFGSFFEAKVAAGMAEFLPRLAQPRNGLWLALQGDEMVGAVAIDGEDLAHRHAHLRWFIVADCARGSGIGKRLLQAALDFCDAQGFAAVQLWTFQGLDAARHLYEAHGFVLAQQWSGEQWGKTMQEQRFIRHAPAACAPELE